MVGDRQVAEPSRCRRLDHHLERGAPVTGEVGVVVEVALDVAQLDEVGQFRPSRGGHLTGVLAHRRRYPGEVEGGVNVFLRCRRHHFLSLHHGQRVLVEDQLSVDGALPQIDVVRLRAGEVDQCGAELLGAYDAQVHLEPGGGEDGCLGLAPGEHLRDQSHRHETLHHRLGVRGGHDDIGVTDGLRQPADAPAGHRRRDAGEAGESGGHLDGDRHGFGDRGPPLLAVESEPPDGTAEVVLGLGAQPGDVADLPGIERGLQALQAVDAEVGVEQADRLRPHPGDAGQLDHGRRELDAQLDHLCDAPGVEVLPDPGGYPLADAGHRGEFGVGHRLHRAGQVCHRLDARTHRRGSGRTGPPPPPTE